MDKSFNFTLSRKGTLTQILIDLDLVVFSKVCKYIHQLPYGRNSSRNDLSLVIKERKGTCSSKHAFLKQIAIEQNFSELSLWIGIYKMNSDNTLGICNVLKEHNLEYIPEAHCYLKYQNKRIDLTFPSSTNLAFEDSILTEQEIQPKQVGEFKVEMHKQYLKQWIKSNNMHYSFYEIWAIREQCIEALEHKKA